MKSTLLLGLSLGLIVSAFMILSVEILVPNSYAPISDSTKLGLANRFNAVADEIDDRGKDASQKIRDNADRLDESSEALREAADNVEDHTSDAAQNLKDKANELLEPKS